MSLRGGSGECLGQQSVCLSIIHPKVNKVKCSSGNNSSGRSGSIPINLFQQWSFAKVLDVLGAMTKLVIVQTEGLVRGGFTK